MKDLTRNRIDFVSDICLLHYWISEKIIGSWKIKGSCWPWNRTIPWNESVWKGLFWKYSSSSNCYCLVIFLQKIFYNTLIFVTNKASKLKSINIILFIYFVNYGNLVRVKILNLLLVLRSVKFKTVAYLTKDFFGIAIIVFLTISSLPALRVDLDLTLAYLSKTTPPLFPIYEVKLCRTTYTDWIVIWYCVNRKNQNGNSKMASIKVICDSIQLRTENVIFTLIWTYFYNLEFQYGSYKTADTECCLYPLQQKQCIHGS